LRRDLGREAARGDRSFADALLTSEILGSLEDSLGMVVADEYPIVGDGWVPHVSSILEGTCAYIADGVDHIRLPMAPRVVRAIVRLLEGQADIGLYEYDGRAPGGLAESA
jgi:hypothetical protein